MSIHYTQMSNQNEIFAFGKPYADFTQRGSKIANFEMT